MKKVYYNDIKHRSFVLLLVFCIFFVGITSRLAYIQFAWSDELRDKAESQWTRELGIYPQRGTIYDSNGLVLAASVTRYSLQAIPNDIKNADSIATLLSPILDMSVEDIYDKISDKTKALVWVKRLLTEEQSKQIRALALNGLELIDEPARVYPYNNLACQVLGFTMKYAEPDGHYGQEGIELFYNDELIGEAGVILRETDNTGKDIIEGSEIYVDATDGNNLVLTIDSVLQSYLQEAAENAMLKFSADGVYAVATNPSTGEVLAMVNIPDYDPNEPPRDLTLSEMQALTKNQTCLLNYEPGSTIKAMILAAALEEGVVGLDDKFYCPGYYTVDGVRIHCSNRSGHGHQTSQTGLNTSCNPVFMQIGERMGVDVLYDYLRKFGFGQKTGIDIAGEESGIMISKDNATHQDWVTMCFGQAIAVTPLQLLTAFNAVVNGGYIYEPYLVKEINRTIENDDGTQSTETIFTASPTVKNQVISEKTSAIMRDALTQVVTNGGGKAASVDGFYIGGKTGTAQTYDEHGNIAEGIDVGSFVGFGPSEDAKISVIFITCNPKGIPFGSAAAAPFVGEFLTNAFAYLELEPSRDKIKGIYFPDLIGLPVEDALAHLHPALFDIAIKGEGNVIVKQSIAPGAGIVSLRKVTLTLGYREIDPLQVQVPDLEGMTLLEANAALSLKGLIMELGESGSGTDSVILDQSIIAGKYVDEGTVVTVFFHKDIPEPTE